MNMRVLILDFQTSELIENILCNAGELRMVVLQRCARGRGRWTVGHSTDIPPESHTSHASITDSDSKARGGGGGWKAQWTGLSAEGLLRPLLAWDVPNPVLLGII